MGCSPEDTECRHDHGLVSKRDDSESPVHPVTITRGFWLGRTSVTVGAYKKFSAGQSNPMPSADLTNPNWRFENHPMSKVNWNDAAAYCAWSGGRLPTEAEWEYAARAGSTALRYGPLDEIAWYRGNARQGRFGSGTHPVATKRSNAFGLFDMLGNVDEWTADWYDPNYYAHSPAADPKGPASGRYRVKRGGSWFYPAIDVRVSQREPDVPGNGFDWYGFRCVWEPR